MGAGLPSQKIEDGPCDSFQSSLETPLWGQELEQVQVEVFRDGSSIIPSRADVHLAHFMATHST